MDAINRYTLRAVCLTVTNPRTEIKESSFGVKHE